MPEGDSEIDVVKIKADYETAIADIDKLKSEIETLKMEKAKLNEYIANYVSSAKPSSNGSSDVEPKSFNELYNEVIMEMKAKKD